MRFLKQLKNKTKMYIIHITSFGNKNTLTQILSLRCIQNVNINDKRLKNGIFTKV